MPDDLSLTEAELAGAEPPAPALKDPATVNRVLPEAVPAQPDDVLAEENDVVADVPPARTQRYDQRTSESQVPAPISRTRWWTRRFLAGVGLLLFAGCLFTLLNGGTLPAWHLRDQSTPVLGTVAVVIDPGHGGWDTGAVAQGVREKDLNLDVGLRVSRVLEARGLKTKLTREDDHFVPLSGRAWIANSLPGAIFVSIHFNDAPAEGHGSSRANGIETFYSEFKESPPAGTWTFASLIAGTKGNAAAGKAIDPVQAVRAGRELADSIQSSLINGTAAIDRGIKERGLYVTRRVQGPAVLVEGGFVSHPAEAKLLGDPNYRQRLAESIADGIVKYLAGTRRQTVGSPLAAVRNGGE